MKFRAETENSRAGLIAELVGGAFWSDPRYLTFLMECQLPDSLSPASHPDDRRDGNQRCRCVWSCLWNWSERC